jgi:hypothetical protein
MKSALVLVVGVLTIAVTTAEATHRPGHYGTSTVPTVQPAQPSPGSWGSGQYYQPQAQQPTIVTPPPRPMYPQEPTLGDTPYRNTDPKTCRSLLCD